MSRRKDPDRPPTSYCAAHPRYAAGCVDCQDICRAYNAARRGRRARLSLPAAEVAEHLGRLRHAGMSVRAIAERAAISRRHVQVIAAGGIRRCTTALAEAVLAIPVPAPTVPALADMPVRNGGGRSESTETHVSARPARMYAIVLREQRRTLAEIAAAAGDALLAGRRALVAAGRLADDAPVPRRFTAGEIGRLVSGEQRWIALERAQAVLDIGLPALPTLPVGAVHIHGTRRRLQGLGVDGHAMAEVARLLDMRPQDLDRTVLGRSKWIGAYRADRIARAVETVLAGPEHPRATWIRNRAQRLGWLPLDAWHDGAIDDPYGLPDLATDAETVDEVKIRRAFHGEITVDALTPAERLAAVRAMAAAGCPDKEIAERLRWGAGARGAAVLAYRQYHAIPSGMPDPTGKAADPDAAWARRHGLRPVGALAG